MKKVLSIIGLVILFYIASVCTIMGISEEEGGLTFFGVILFGLFIWGVVKVRAMRSRSTKRSYTSNSTYKNPIAPVVPVMPVIEKKTIDPNVCPNCSHKVEEGMFFCDQCGTRIH